MVKKSILYRQLDKDWLEVGRFSAFGDAYLAASLLTTNLHRNHKVVDGSGKSYPLNAQKEKP